MTVNDIMWENIGFESLHRHFGPRGLLIADDQFDHIIMVTDGEVWEVTRFVMNMVERYDDTQ